MVNVQVCACNCHFKVDSEDLTALVGLMLEPLFTLSSAAQHDGFRAAEVSTAGHLTSTSTALWPWPLPSSQSTETLLIADACLGHMSTTSWSASGLHAAAYVAPLQVCAFAWLARSAMPTSVLRHCAEYWDAGWRSRHWVERCHTMEGAQEPGVSLLCAGCPLQNFATPHG